MCGLASSPRALDGAVLEVQVPGVALGVPPGGVEA